MLYRAAYFLDHQPEIMNIVPVNLNQRPKVNHIFIKGLLFDWLLSFSTLASIPRASDVFFKNREKYTRGQIIIGDLKTDQKGIGVRVYDSKLFSCVRYSFFVFLAFSYNFNVA